MKTARALPVPRSDLQLRRLRISLKLLLRPRTSTPHFLANPLHTTVARRISASWRKGLCSKVFSFPWLCKQTMVRDPFSSGGGHNGSCVLRRTEHPCHKLIGTACPLLLLLPCLRSSRQELQPLYATLSHRLKTRRGMRAIHQAQHALLLKLRPIFL